MSDNAIRFSAQVFKIATTIDGGIRLTLDMGATDPNMVMALINAKQPGVILECACLAVRPDLLNNNEVTTNAVQRRSEWQPEG